MAALLLAAVLGLGIVAAALFAGARAVVRALARGRRGVEFWLGLALLAPLVGYWLTQAWSGTFRHGDEVTDFHATLLSAFTGFDPVDRAYPSFHAIVCGALQALFVVARRLAGDATLARTAVETVLFHSHALLFVARLVSVAACGGILVVSYRLTARIAGVRWAGLFPVAFLLTDVEFLRWPFWLSPHPLALFLALLFLDGATREPDPKASRSPMALLGVLFGAGVSTHLFVLFVAPAALLPLVQRRGPARPLRALLVFFAVSAVVAGAVNFPVFRYPQDYHYVLGRHVAQLAGPGASLLVALGVVVGLLLATAAAYALVRFLRAHAWRGWTPLLGLALPAAIFLVVFATATLVMPWYPIYPQALLAALVAVALVGITQRHATAKLVGAIALLALAAALPLRLSLPLPEPQTASCLDGLPRAAAVTALARTHAPAAGKVGFFDNSLFAFERAAHRGLLASTLVTEAAALVRERAAREVRWLPSRDPPADLWARRGELATVIHLSWTALEDPFRADWAEGLTPAATYATEICTLRVYSAEPVRPVSGAFLHSLREGEEGL
jgi:hypothetical protein